MKKLLPLLLTAVAFTITACHSTIPENRNETENSTTTETTAATVTDSLETSVITTEATVTTTTENLVYDYDDYSGFTVVLPTGWFEWDVTFSPIYAITDGDVRIHVTLIYSIADSYDECENAAEVLDVLFSLSSIDFNSDRYTFIDKSSYHKENYDVIRIAYHDNHQWGYSWNEYYIVGYGDKDFCRYFSISLGTYSEEDYYKYRPDIEYVVDNFVIKETVECEKCGAINSETAEFCEYCIEPIY